MFRKHCFDLVKAYKQCQEHNSSSSPLVLRGELKKKKGCLLGHPLKPFLESHHENTLGGGTWEVL